MIYIISAPIQTGKTTQLTKWVAQKLLENESIAGILSPVVEGKRHIFSIASQEMKLLEAASSAPNTIEVGRFVFQQEVFDWAKEEIWKGVKSEPKYLIIDEIGKLELQGKGLEPTIAQALESYRDIIPYIILVIRDTLLEKAITHYQLKQFQFGLP